jgi:hypothetical protein
MFAALCVHLLTKIGILLLAIPFVRMLLRKAAFEPGAGPDRETSRKVERAEFRAVGRVEGV